MLRLILVRHGETVENLQQIMQGQSLGRLSGKGKKEVMLLARRLATVAVDSIFSSDLERAEKTTQALARFHKCLVKYDVDLRERSSGIFECKSNREYQEAVQSAHTSAENFRPEGGESIVDLSLRTNRFIEQILNLPRPATVIVSSHSGPLACMLLRLLGRPLIDFWTIQLRNTSVSEFVFEKGSDVKSFSIDCIRHLNNVANS